MSNAGSSTLAKLTVTGPEGSRDLDLKAAGMIIGRSSNCDVVLPDDYVSRRHARLFCDPFGRWIIEDLQSRNGIKVEGKAVQTHAMLPGERVTIGPFSLLLPVPEGQAIAPDPEAAASTTTIITDIQVANVVHSRPQAQALLSRARLKNLNVIVDRLSALTGASRLYVELCRLVARAPQTVAIVLRLSPSAGQQPQILASHFGGDESSQSQGRITDFHISRTVLEAVRAGRVAVMAGSGSETNIMLTISDDAKPRSVFCCPLCDPEAEPASSECDVLYLDFPGEMATEDTFDFVQAVGRQVNLIRKSLLLTEARTQRQVLDHQLSMARDLQRQLMPQQLQNPPGTNLAVCYEPAMWVGGDYYDVWALPDGKLAMVVGDVSGKGLPAAMVMANLQATLRNTLAFCPNLADAVKHANNFMQQHLPSSMFVTLFLGLFSPPDGRLEYVNAGHLQPMVVYPGARPELLGVPLNPPLGVPVEGGLFQADSQVLPAGSGIVIYTDGVTEAVSPAGQMFGTDRMLERFGEGAVETAQSLVDRLAQAVTDFRQTMPPQDDQTILALVRQQAGEQQMDDWRFAPPAAGG